MNKLDHPCRNTCSGWQQGYEKGYAACAEAKRADAFTQLEAERARSAKLIEALRETVDWWETGDALSAIEAAKEAIVEYEASK